MPREQFVQSTTPVPFDLNDWVNDLSRARKRLDADASECPRVSAMSNALGKISGIIKNDLQRLKQMGIRPTPENAVIQYHPRSR